VGKEGLCACERGCVSGSYGRAVLLSADHDQFRDRCSVKWKKRGGGLGAAQEDPGLVTLPSGGGEKGGEGRRECRSSRW